MAASVIDPVDLLPWDDGVLTPLFGADDEEHDHQAASIVLAPSLDVDNFVVDQNFEAEQISNFSDVHLWPEAQCAGIPVKLVHRVTGESIELPVYANCDFAYELLPPPLPPAPFLFLEASCCIQMAARQISLATSM